MDDGTGTLTYNSIQADISAKAYKQHHLVGSNAAQHHRERSNVAY